MSDMLHAVKVLKKKTMLYNGVFGCHGNTCYVILLVQFFICYIV